MAIPRLLHRAFALLPLGLLGLGGLLLTAPATAQATPPNTLAVKAALLFKLPRFTYLTHLEDQSVLNLCILGTHPFGETLQALAQTPIDERTVALHHLGKVQEIRVCDIIFIANTAQNRWSLKEIIAQISTPSTLTVSDIHGFAEAGGMVELAAHAQDTSKVQILINQTAAANQGIKFNAQLLRLATLLP